VFSPSSQQLLTAGVLSLLPAVADDRCLRVLMTEPVLQQVFKFGRHLISHRQVFLKTTLSYAFTNRKPILPGRIFHSLALTTP